MALSSDRNTPRKEGDLRQFSVGAGVTIFAGALVCLNAAGFLVPGAASPTLVSVGRAEANVDNSSGADGDLTVEVRRGFFRFSNSSGADEISVSDIGKSAYVVDDEVVALTDGAGARSVAGSIYDVDAQGVWIEI